MICPDCEATLPEDSFTCRSCGVGGGTDLGTRVNGNPVERVELHGGRLVQMGKASIKFKFL